MAPSNNNTHLTTLRSLFKCREDVFAIRWEKPPKSGYMPAYFYDAYRYRMHKMQGGTFQNYTDKTYQPLTDEQLIKHLEGKHHIGVYPLLPDNTSWFIAADFDGKNWQQECVHYMDACATKGISTYLERSRSGNGGHVWIFFSQPYPAFKSRKIVLSLLTETGVISRFDKNSSFDRLFPNQDKLSGKGFGNLIALPMHGPSLSLGNSCFIDPVSFTSFSDQWAFLEKVNRVETSLLDSIFEGFAHGGQLAGSSKEPTIEGVGLVIALTNVIRMNKYAIPSALDNFLREELNFTNSEFVAKKASGRQTFGTERFFRLIEEEGNNILLPRGFVGKLLRFCKNCSIPFEFKDIRVKQPPVKFSFNTAIRSYQEDAITASNKKDLGVIVAPPGTGKTVIGLNIIANKQQPALIVVHRQLLMDQWMERIEAFLGIPKSDIGKIGQGKVKIGEKITVATIQSLTKEIVKDGKAQIKNAFGTILVDECHHVPAKSYRDTIQQLHTFYMYGLTATPFRKYNDGRLIFTHLGEIIAEITPAQAGKKQAEIIVRQTDLDMPFNSKTDRFETLAKVIVHDSARNKLILDDIYKELAKGNKVAILTERKEHIDTLCQYLKQSYEVIALSGDDSESSRAVKWSMLKAGNFQALVTTGQFFGEGTDLDGISCLFLVFPFSFEGKLVQYIGRVQRSEIAPTIYDYRDIKIDYLNKLFLKRNSYYRKLARQATLFDDPAEEPVSEKSIKETVMQNNASIIINKEITIPLDSLEFRYGGAIFKYDIEQIKDVEFELHNDNLRPEFEVLKPYFIKALKSKTIQVSVYVEIEGDQVVAMSSTSKDMLKINRHLIDTMRFQLVSKPWTKPGVYANIVNAVDEQKMQESHSLYESGEELLEKALLQNNCKHYRHLRYLADRHAGNQLKLRFILQPFSFVFLLEGTDSFHIVMETFDTEEATYIWHFDKNTESLSRNLKAIDLHLEIIRKSGRQQFLISPPTNFSRIIHDYTDDNKGFITWKDNLEERIY